MTESWCVWGFVCVCVHKYVYAPKWSTCISIACIKKTKQNITNLPNSNKILRLWYRLQHSLSNNGNHKNSIYLYNCTNLCCCCVSCSVVSDYETLWIVAHQAPLFMGFPRQEYWSGLPFPSPGDLPNPGIKPGSPVSQADSLPPEKPGRPSFVA